MIPRVPHPRHLLEDTPTDVLVRLERARRTFWHLLFLTGAAATVHAVWVTSLALDPSASRTALLWQVPLALMDAVPGAAVDDQVLLEQAWSVASFVPAAGLGMHLLWRAGLPVRDVLADRGAGTMPRPLRRSRRTPRRRLVWLAAGLVCLYALLLRIDYGAPAWPAHAMAAWVAVGAARFGRDHWTRLISCLPMSPTPDSGDLEPAPRLDLLPDRSEVA